MPAQTSVYVTSLLFAVCQEISRIGGQALDQSVLSELSRLMMEGVVEHYDTLLNKYLSTGHDDDGVRGIPQQCALQLLFNLNFLSNMLIVQEVSLPIIQSIINEILLSVD